MVFTKKGIIQKITIVLVVLILFNFIAPSYSRAGWIESAMEGIGDLLVKGITFLGRTIGDAGIHLLQMMFIGTDPIDGNNYQIALSPGKIFSGKIYALNINFIGSKSLPTDTADNTNTNKNIENEKWYKDFLKSKKDIGNAISTQKFKGDNDKRIAYTTVNVLISKPKTAEEIENAMKNWSSKFGEITDPNEYKEKLYEEFNPANAFITEDYNEEKVKAYVQSCVHDEGLKTAVQEYMDATKESKLDAVLTVAAKPENAPVYVLHDVIASWYKIMRNIMLLFLLSVLVYVGIRIMISSTAADTTKYKKMLIDWVVAICILFALHYIMAFLVNFTDLITQAFSGTNISATSPDEIMNTIREGAATDGTTGLGYVVVYLVLIFYTVYFLFYYVKRVVYIAFLTLISPFVALTYPLDRIGDSKAQAFNMWFKEYLLNVIIQPVHLIIYTVMVTSSMELAKTNFIYAIVVIGAMIPAEKFIKEMFGLESKKGPKGGLLAGAATMTAMQKLAGRKPPEFGHDSSKANKESSNKEEKNKKPRMANGESRKDNASAYVPGEKTASNKSTDQPGIDDGQYEDSRSKQKDPDQQAGDDGTVQLTDEQKQQLGNNEEMQNSEEMEGIDSPSEAEINGTLRSGADNQNEENAPAEEPYHQISEQGNVQAEESHHQIPSQENDTQAPSGNEVNPPTTNEVSSKSKKKKSLAGRAVAATAGHYARKVVNGKNLKKLGRGIVKHGLGAVTAGAGAAIGLAAGVATGDPTKAWQYATAGGLAGAKIGQHAGDGVANLVGGTVDGVKGITDTYKENYKGMTEKYDHDAYEKIVQDENKKKYGGFLRSTDTIAAINNRYGMTGPKKTKEIQDAIVRYKNAGVDDLDIIFNSYNLENGMDAEGNVIKDDNGNVVKLDQQQAMYAAQIASRGYDPDNEASRKAALSTAQYDFAQEYQNKHKGVSMDVAADEGKKIAREQLMPYLDMAAGKSYKEAQRLKAQASFQKAYEDAKEEKGYKKAAKANAEAQAKTTKNKETKTWDSIIDQTWYQDGNNK